MFRKLLIILTFALFCASVLNANAQIVLENGKIPSNLLITFERVHSYKIQINADGDVFYEAYGTKMIIDGVDATDSFINTSPNKSTANSQKKIKEAKKTQIKIQDKLTVSQLKKLIAVFEKIDFLNLRDKYPSIGFPENSSTLTGCVDARESIDLVSIRIGKITKRVENDLNCHPRQISLEELADKIVETVRIVQTKEFK